MKYKPDNDNPNRSIDDRLVLSLRDLTHVMRSLYEGKGSQKRLLIMLSRIEQTTQKELTEAMGIRPASASEIIAKLESAGLISRTQSQEDRRTMNISLTEAGRQKAEDAVNARKIRHQEMFSCLEPEEKESLLATLEKLQADWDARYCSEGRRDGKGCKDNACDEHGGQHGRHKMRCRQHAFADSHPAYRSEEDGESPCGNI